MKRGHSKYYIDKISKKYNFDYNNEMTIYLYLQGEKLSFSQRKYLKNNSHKVFTLYSEWDWYIKEKYRNYDLKKLKELYRHLEYRKRLAESSIHYTLVTSSAILSIFVVDILKQPLTKILSIKATPFIMVLLFLVLVFWFHRDNKRNKIRVGLFQDYMKIINRMILKREMDYLKKIKIRRIITQR